MFPFFTLTTDQTRTIAVIELIIAENKGKNYVHEGPSNFGIYFNAATAKGKIIVTAHMNFLFVKTVISFSWL